MVGATNQLARPGPGVFRVQLEAHTPARKPCGIIVCQTNGLSIKAGSFGAFAWPHKCEHVRHPQFLAMPEHPTVAYLPTPPPPPHGILPTYTGAPGCP